VAFLNEQVFQTPQWLFNKEISAKLGTVSNEVNRLGVAVLGGLLLRANGVQSNSRMFEPENTYYVPEFLNDVKKGVWGELLTGATINTYRRDLQTAYIGNLLELIKVLADKPVSSGQAEMVVLGKIHLIALQKEIKMGIQLEKDVLCKAHLQYCSERIEDALHPKK